MGVRSVQLIGKIRACRFYRVLGSPDEVKSEKEEDCWPKQLSLQGPVHLRCVKDVPKVQMSNQIDSFMDVVQICMNLYLGRIQDSLKKTPSSLNSI